MISDKLDERADISRLERASSLPKIQIEFQRRVYLANKARAAEVKVPRSRQVSVKILIRADYARRRSRSISSYLYLPATELQANSTRNKSSRRGARNDSDESGQNICVYRV